MIRLAGIFVFLVASHSLFGQQALSDNVKGQWCIHANGERRMLDPAIHELGNFDACGLTYFMRYEKFGIINEKGEFILDESYESIKQLEGGYYLLLKDGAQFLANWKNDTLNIRKVFRTKMLDRNWQFATFDSLNVLINVYAQKEWSINSEKDVLESDFGYLYCQLDSSKHLFNANGMEINLDGSNPIFGREHLLVDCKMAKRIIYRSHEISLPIDARNIRFRDDEIMYSNGNKTTILNSLNGQVISVFPFDDLSYFSNNLFLVRTNGKVGLYNRDAKMIVPPNYSSISYYGGLFNVRTTSGAGVLDRQGNELVPCKYNFVVAYRDFFTLHNQIDFVGLMSRKTGKIILPCDYSKMVLSNSKIRAFTGTMLRILELDSNHRIINDLVLSNVTSLVHSKASAAVGADERLYPLGWFNELVPEYDSLGFMVNERLKWGLKGENDSVLIKPRFKEPTFVHQADFSLVETAQKKMILPGLNERRMNQLLVMSHRTGKMLVPEPILDLDTMDLLTRSYSRFVSEKGPGVLLDDNKILRADYIDGQDTRYVRYCTSKKREIQPAEKSDYDAIRYPDYDLNNDPNKSLSVNIDNKNYENIRFLNTEWNFLDTAGRTVFTNPFDFADPFHYETAIVLKDGYWGVVRADSFAIDLVNTSVKRSPISDTLFVVQRKANGLRFLDINAKVLTNGITQFYRDNGAFSQVQMNGEKVLIGLDYEVISGDTKFQKLLDNGIFYSKENKEYTVYDANGTLLGSFKERPEEVWFERYALMKSRGKYGLLSVDSDTLIPFKHKEIRQVGNYIFAKDGIQNLLFNDQLQLINKCKRNEVLADSLTGDYAIIQDGKATLYNSDQRKIGKISGAKFEHYYNGRLLDFDKKLRILNGEEELTFDFQANSIEHLGENGCLIIDSEKRGHYFDTNWEEISYESSLDRAQDVGEGLSISRNRTSLLLFGGDFSIEFEGAWRNVGKFTNGFLLLQNGKDFQFVDVKGINQFRRTFEDATPFSGELAAVKETDGWTLIDGEGHFRILPGFGRITPHTKTLFSTPAQPVYGLFDSHGNVLIPVEFQQINFLRNGIIQGRKNGEIFYFDIYGKPIILN